MSPQDMRNGLLAISGGTAHSGFATSRETIKRIAGLVGSRESALQVVAEAERIGLIVPEPFPEDPEPLDRMWHLAGGFDTGKLGARA